MRRHNVPSIAEPEPQDLVGAELSNVAGGEQAGACLGMLQAAAPTVGAAGNPDRPVGVALQQGGRQQQLLSGDGLPMGGRPIGAGGHGSGLVVIGEATEAVLGPVGQQPRAVGVIPCPAHLTGLGLGGRPPDVVGTADAGLSTVRPLLIQAPPCAVEYFKVHRGNG